MSGMAETIEHTLRIFAAEFGSPDGAHIGWSPGRVNLIGEHTDYNKGFALPMAIDLGVCVVLRPRRKSGLTVYAELDRAAAEVSLGTAEFAEMPRWARYVAGTAVLSRERGSIFSGFDVVVNGNLNIGGGLSSSAALCTATALAVQSATRYTMSALDTARLCQTVEHRFAGVQCGIMDQMACRMGRADHALFVDCESLESVSVPMPSSGAHLLIVDSGVPRSLHASDYNLRRTECAQAVDAIRESQPGIESLRQVSPEMLERDVATLSDKLLRRARHVVTENARVIAARAALEGGRLDEFGRLMTESHVSLRNDFEVSVEELDFIVETANELPGVLGARLTGAGFGGNVLILVENEADGAVADHISTKFADRYDREPPTHCVAETNPASAYPR